jgi:UPF0755 protein
VTLAVLAVLVVAGIGVWYAVEAGGGPGGRAEVVTIGDGESLSAVLDSLSSHGVMGSPLAFRLGDLFTGSPAVTPGTYLFRRGQSFGEVRQILNAGPDVFAVDVLPGYTLREVAEQVADVPGHQEAGFLAASRQVPSPWAPAGSDNLEGLLGTGTYLVLPGESDRQLVGDMVARFDATAAAAGLTEASAAALGMTPYQVITAASIVQKEGYIVKNMGPVARVIYNRVASGTPLQMDSTVLYSLGQDGGPVTQHDLALDTPYNTYLHVGLTPTPICMPSLAALHAAVHPPPGQWLFFVVVDKDGTEAFADTYGEQLANEHLAAQRGLP